MMHLRRLTSRGSNDVRFTLSLVLITLLIINTGGWVFYAKAKDYMEVQSQKRLIAVAKAVAAQIDGEKVFFFQPGDELSDSYLEEQRKLARLRDDADLDNIFLFAPYLGMLIHTRSDFAVGEYDPLIDIERAELSPLWEGKPAPLPLYKIEGERFQSAFVPLLEGGELRAVIGVDASARFLADLAILLQGLLAIAALSIVLAGTLGIFVHRNAKRLVSLHGEIKDREKLAALGTLTAGLAHEIRNPLGIIRASAELLEEEEVEREIKFGTMIVEEVDRLSELLTSFLDFAKPKEVNSSIHDLGELVRQILVGVGPEFNDKGVRLEQLREEDRFDVSMDVDQIKQVLLNLLLNARDAVNGGGEVAITLTHRKRPRHGALFPSKPEQDNEYVEVTVEDNGEGIEDEKMDNLFDPFFTTKKDGTGLGLSIVHGIIKNHSGYLFVESEMKRGTRIGFALPI